MQKKKAMVALGVTLGLFASVFAMIPTAKPMNAAIPVIDEKNIAQAIEMVNRTQKILNDQDKELLLAVLNAKKLDGSMINKYMQSYVNTMTGPQGPLSGYLKKNGIGQITIHGIGGDITVDASEVDENGKFNGQAAIQKAWVERLGSLQDVLNGKTTLAGAALDEIEREKALDQTFLDAALAAEDAQKTNADVAEATQNLLEQMPNTQGVLQNIQIGNQLNAQSVVALLNLNKQVASQIQAEAVHYQDKALQRARRLKADEYQRKAAAEALGQQ